MPLYEYLCDACGHQFEHIQKFSDALQKKCPKCGGSVHKLQSAPAIQFKGSGFYITDYAKKEHTAAAKADSASPDAKSEGGAAETKDAKPADAAAKTETKTDKAAAGTDSSKTTSPPPTKSAPETKSTPTTKST
jgi:putative FmdB family regulatory protein